MRAFTSLAAAFVVFMAACNRGASSRPASVGQPAPQFSITDSDRTVSLNDFRGRVVLLNFWASWCPPCIEELPSLTEMAQKAQQRGIVVLAVSEDESDSDYHRFLAEHHSDILTVRDVRRNTAPRYGTYVFPETYVIDPAGIIRRKFIGAIDWSKPEILESLVRLQAQAPTPSRAAK